MFKQITIMNPRWTVVLVIALCIAAFAGDVPVLGAFIQENAFPHGSPRVILGPIRRDDTMICWTWEFQKYRDGPVDIWDFHISGSAGSAPFAPFRDPNGQNPQGFSTNAPPTTEQSFPVGSYNIASFCADIPSWEPPGDKITIRGRMGYRGPFDWWINWIEAPTIVSDGTTQTAAPR